MIATMSEVRENNNSNSNSNNNNNTAPAAGWLSSLFRKRPDGSTLPLGNSGSNHNHNLNNGNHHSSNASGNHLSSQGGSQSQGQGRRESMPIMTTMAPLKDATSGPRQLTRTAGPSRSSSTTDAERRPSIPSSISGEDNYYNDYDDTDTVVSEMTLMTYSDEKADLVKEEFFRRMREIMKKNGGNMQNVTLKEKEDLLREIQVEQEAKFRKKQEQDTSCNRDNNRHDHAPMKYNDEGEEEGEDTQEDFLERLNVLKLKNEKEQKLASATRERQCQPQPVPEERDREDLNASYSSDLGASYGSDLTEKQQGHGQGQGGGMNMNRSHDGYKRRPTLERVPEVSQSSHSTPQEVANNNNSNDPLYHHHLHQQSNDKSILELRGSNSSNNLNSNQGPSLGQSRRASLVDSFCSIGTTKRGNHTLKRANHTSNTAKQNWTPDLTTTLSSRELESQASSSSSKGLDFIRGIQDDKPQPPPHQYQLSSPNSRKKNQVLLNQNQGLIPDRPPFNQSREVRQPQPQPTTATSCLKASLRDNILNVTNSLQQEQHSSDRVGYYQHHQEEEKKQQESCHSQDSSFLSSHHKQRTSTATTTSTTKNSDQRSTTDSHVTDTSKASSSGLTAYIDDIIELKLLVANQQATIDTMSSKLHNLELANRQLKAREEARVKNLEAENWNLTRQLNESREREIGLRKEKQLECSHRSNDSSSSSRNKKLQEENRNLTCKLNEHQKDENQQQQTVRRNSNESQNSENSSVSSGGGKLLKAKNLAFKKENSELRRQLQEMKSALLLAAGNNRQQQCSGGGGNDNMNDNGNRASSFHGSRRSSIASRNSHNSSVMDADSIASNAL